MGRAKSAEAAGDVGLSCWVVGVGEDLRRGPVLDQAARLADAGEVEEGGRLRDTSGLLHVVGHDDDRVALFELVDEVLDCADVEIGSRAEHGSSINSTWGSTAIARAMQRRCC